MLVSLGGLRGKACGSARFEGAKVDRVDEVLYDTPKCYVFSANDDLHSLLLCALYDEGIKMYFCMERSFERWSCICV